LIYLIHSPAPDLKAWLDRDAGEIDDICDCDGQLALDRSNEVRLEIAGQLVDRFGARVIGITAGEFSPPLYFATGEQAQMVIDQGKAAIRKRTAGLESEFRASMQNRAAVVEWRCAGEFPTGVIVQQARAADIIVVGADGRDALADPFMQANPSDLIMQLGRPLLVVPESGKWLDLRSILIAWKATPEARRAIVDALPCYAKPRMSPSSKLSRTMSADRRHRCA